MRIKAEGPTGARECRHDPHPHPPDFPRLEPTAGLTMTRLAVLNALPTSYSTPELNVPCAEGEPKLLVQKLLETAKFPGALEIITIDGLRAEYKDGFGLIRSSNTTPVLVMRFEGHTEKALHRIEAAFMAALRVVKPDAQIAAAAH